MVMIIMMLSTGYPEAVTYLLGIPYLLTFCSLKHSLRFDVIQSAYRAP